MNVTIYQSMLRIGALIVKELRQRRWDRLTFAMIVGIPTLQLVLFGYAINFDVRHLSAAVADLAQTSASRQLALDLGHSQVLDVRSTWDTHRSSTCATWSPPAPNWRN